MQIKTILDRIQTHASFVYKDARLVEDDNGLRIDIRIEPRANSRSVFSCCHRRRPGYDRLTERRFQFVPL